MPNPDARTGASAVAEAHVVELLSELPDDYSIICNVTIFDEKRTRARSELDTVVVTPLDAVALLEIKSGNVDVNEHGSLVRSYAGRDVEKDLSNAAAPSENATAASGSQHRLAPLSGASQRKYQRRRCHIK